MVALPSIPPVTIVDPSGEYAVVVTSLGWGRVRA
jgi:hypothetical protein